MKTGILGFLIGTGLFVNGFIHHDYDEDIYIHRWQRLHWYADDNNQENKAYLIGMAGAVIATVSIRHLLDRNKPQSSKKSRWFPKVLLGTGLMYSGLWLHEMGGNHDWNATFEHLHEEGERTSKVENNIREHLGFGVGTIGSAGLGLAVKDIWDLRKREKQIDLDQVYVKFREQLKK